MNLHTGERLDGKLETGSNVDAPLYRAKPVEPRTNNKIQK